MVVILEHDLLDEWLVGVGDVLEYVEFGSLDVDFQ